MVLETAGAPECVELFFDEVSLGVDSAAPFEWTGEDSQSLLGIAPGSYLLRAIARKGDESVETQAQVTVVQEGSRLVQVEVSDVDEQVVLWVNGVPRRSWRRNGPGQGKLQDISGWFGAGTNTVRFQQFNANDNSATGFSARLLVDGRIEKELENHKDVGGRSIEFDESFTVELEDLPALREVMLDGPTGAAIYMNHVFSGLRTPVAMNLPQGDLLVGLGVGDYLGNNRYAGNYHEQEISVSAEQTIDLTKGAAPRPVVWKVALLPVRTTHHGGMDAQNTGILQDEDIDKMMSQLEATNTHGIVPVSFGLMKWDITRLPVTDTALFRPADSGQWPRSDELLTDAGLTDLKKEYDLIVTVYSEHRANGEKVANTPCCGWGGGKGMSIPTGWVRSKPANEPNQGYIHEALHSYESYQGWLLYKLPTTLGGLHGGQTQGYQSGDCGEVHWMCWYKDFIRGQVGLSLAHTGDEVQDFPEQPNGWGGVFYTMRMGAGGKVHGPLSQD